MRGNQRWGWPAVPVTLVTGLVAVGLLTGGCARKADLSQPFAMAMNGGVYESSLREPVAYVDEMEAGFSTSYRCTLLFPLKKSYTMNRPGVQIEFDPTKITPGETLSFEAGSEPYGVTVDYYPVSGHDMSRGVILGFSSARSGGSCTIRFDELDCQLGGRVRGKLIRATLHGYKEDAHSGEVTELKGSRKLELANFSFDATLQRMDQALVRQASGVTQPE
jgi:hypothetical protein